MRKIFFTFVKIIPLTNSGHFVLLGKLNPHPLMLISYKKLWKKLIDKGLNKTALQTMSKISSRSMAKLSQNKEVAMGTLLKICEVLDCDVSEIMEFEKEALLFDDLDNIVNADGTTEQGKNSASGKFQFIDLFAGIGGIRLAFEANDCNCVFSSEWDQHAQKTYHENFGEWPAGDITKIDPESIPDFDILTGGFPCQPFSMIGRREGFNHKTQGTLFFHIAEILRVKQPNAFLLENVPGLVTHDKGQTYKIIIETLTELGYSVSTRVLNSADFSVPQYRKRLYFVGFKKELNAKFKFPMGNGKIVGVGQFVEKDAEGPSISALTQKYLFKKDDGHPEIIDCNSDFPVKTLCASYHKIQRITGTFVRGGKTGLRLLTESECKSIMGFPQDYKIPVSRTQMYHQFGNSVAVPVVTAIAKNLVESLDNALNINKEYVTSPEVEQVE